MKNKHFLKVSFHHFFTVTFLSCSTSHETIVLEKNKKEICLIIITSIRKKTTQTIKLFYKSVTPKFQLFNFLLLKNQCNILVKIEPSSNDKTVNYFILDNLDDFDIPMTDKDASLLNKLSPIN